MIMTLEKIPQFISKKNEIKKNLLPVNCKKIHEHTIQVHKVRDK